MFQSAREVREASIAFIADEWDRNGGEALRTDAQRAEDFLATEWDSDLTALVKE